MSDYIEVDGLRVGPCMWRNAKDEITRLRAENEALCRAVLVLEGGDEVNRGGTR